MVGQTQDSLLLGVRARVVDLSVKRVYKPTQVLSVCLCIRRVCVKGPGPVVSVDPLSSQSSVGGVAFTVVSLAANGEFLGLVETFPLLQLH